MKRETARRQRDASIKLQSAVRSFLDRVKWKRALRQECEGVVAGHKKQETSLEPLQPVWTRAIIFYDADKDKDTLVRKKKSKTQRSCID